MAELSIILRTDNDTSGIEKCVKSIFDRLSNADLEVIIVNYCTLPAVNDILASIEAKHSEEVMIVNCNETDRDSDPLDIALNYASGCCFLKPDPNFPIKANDLDSLMYDSQMIDEDLFKFLKDKFNYIFQSAGSSSFPYLKENEQCCLTDYRQTAGNIDPHYYFQDIYVAKKIKEAGIQNLYDIGSRVDGFISHLLCMDINVTMIDVRPLPYSISGLSFFQGNATSLTDIKDDSIPALSSLHALEHFGLGRYGDPVDFEAWKKALNEYSRVLSPGGNLFLSVPVGNKEKVLFNAHRIFDPYTIVEQISDKMILKEFSYLHEGKQTVFDFSKSEKAETIRVLCEIRQFLLGSYDCGIFIFEKGGMK